MTISNTNERSPVVAIMGHVDHGKSSLLDYIRKTNIVDGEAGGITQHISTYEVHLEDNKRITFLDTPGHAAFDNMRHRGGTIADIAILIVSAEDGVKTQTKHAIEVIKKNDIPYIVAINKIDKPAANPEKVKTDLLEEGIYVEGYGGDVPFSLISAKTGQGVDDLLESLILVAEMEEMTGDHDKLASGFVVESHRDPKQGVSATLVIKDGTISKGQFVVVDDSITPTRMLRDFTGKAIDTAHFSSPIQLIGFDKLPPVGSRFATFETKKDAEQAIAEFKEIEQELKDRNELLHVPDGVALVPVILKTDVAGTGEAISEQIEKMTTDDVIFKIIKAETGSINESDVKLALSDPNTVIVGFHVNEDANIKNLNEYEDMTIQSFDIIYKLTEWFEELYELRRIKKEIETTLGSLKVLKVFSSQQGQTLVGGSITSGTITKNEICKIVRSGDVVGKGKIIALQQGKTSTDKVTDVGTECGIMIQTKDSIQERDTIETFIKEIK
ncbi:MAG: translation initiation factor IF-2 [Candidatus Pacebacteria bacterium]|nr:translation initiation factor IF-2 [Candidatus Paceibacterota bacterium]